MSELNQFACCIGKYKNFAVNDDSELSAGKIKEENVLIPFGEEYIFSARESASNGWFSGLF